MSPKSHSRVPLAAPCILFICMLFSLTVNAQRRTPGIGADGDVMGGSNRNSGGVIRQDGWALSIGGGYEEPHGNLKDVYKATPLYSLMVTRRIDNWIYSGTVDFREYKPKQTEFPYDYDDSGTTMFSATYSNYRGIGGYFGIAYEVPLTGLIDVYGGINAGLVFTKYNMKATDNSTIDFSYYENTKVSYFGPKLGFNVALGRNMAIGVEGRYSFSVTGYSYNTRSGSTTTPGFSALSGNLYLTFNF